MTRKDYIKFAKLINDMTAECSPLGAFDPECEQVLQAMASDMCMIFIDDNPNFDRARFLAACGVI